MEEAMVWLDAISKDTATIKILNITSNIKNLGDYLSRLSSEHIDAKSYPRNEVCGIFLLIELFACTIFHLFN